MEVIGALDGEDVATLIDEATALTGGEALTLTVRYTAADVRHLVVAALRIQHWAAETQSWSTLASTVDLTAQQVTAPATRFGLYQLLAPLRCPADATEPDDHDLAATPIGAGEAPVQRLLDSAEDEDWLRIDLTAGTPYVVVIQQEGAPGVLWDLLSHDGVTPLASDATMTAAPPFTPLATGVHYLRLRPPAQAMVDGCTAAYRVQVAPANVPPLYLPLVVQ